MPHITVRDTKLFYQQMGSGPDVVLLHGVTGNLAVWMLSGLMSKLAKQFRVTAYDLRGHGASETPSNGYTSADASDDLAALQEALDLQPAYLMGHSFGGVVALHAAMRHPQRNAGVVLSDPFVPALRYLQPDTRQWKGFAAYQANAAKAGMVIEGDLWDLHEMVEQAATLPEERRRMFIDHGGKSTYDRLVRLHGTSCGVDVAKVAGLTEERIARVSQPIVCLYGEHSPFMPMCERLTELLSNCSVDIIPGAQHFAFEENPAEFVDRVERHFCEMTGQTATAPSVGFEGARRNVMTDTIVK